MNTENLLADRTKDMDASAIREILKVVSRPGMVSLAGGIPAPESFPMEIISDLTARVITRYGSSRRKVSGPCAQHSPFTSRKKISRYRLKMCW